MTKKLVLAVIVLSALGCGSKSEDGPLKVEGAPGAPPKGATASGIETQNATTPPIPGG